jgi:hypothetical protein
MAKQRHAFNPRTFLTSVGAGRMMMSFTKGKQSTLKAMRLMRCLSFKRAGETRRQVHNRKGSNPRHLEIAVGILLTRYPRADPDGRSLAHPVLIADDGRRCESRDKDGGRAVEGAIGQPERAYVSNCGRWSMHNKVGEFMVTPSLERYSVAW